MLNRYRISSFLLVGLRIDFYTSGKMGGNYFVKSFYIWLSKDDYSNPMPAWSSMWILNIPPKMKFFFWQACMNCLPTRDLLRIKRVDCPTNCILCSADVETTVHLFRDCGFTGMCGICLA